MDWVGSDRFGHYIDGRIVAYDHPYAPYGESYAYEGGGLTQGYMFAGIPSDIYQPRALGLFEAPNRELSQVQGRWLSPTPQARVGMLMPIPQIQTASPTQLV